MHRKQINGKVKEYILSRALAWKGLTSSKYSAPDASLSIHWHTSYNFFPSRNRESTVLNKSLTTHKLKRTTSSQEFLNNVIRSPLSTPHFNGKKLWNNSTWDFELIFHTMDINWLSPRQNFVHSSLVSRWRCDQFF